MGAASASKAVSRQIRRAFGPEALEVIADHQSRLEALEDNTIPNLRNWTEAVVGATRLDSQIDTKHLRQALTDETVARQNVDALLEHKTGRFMVDFTSMNLLARLRWLLTGRLPVLALLFLLLSTATASAVDRTVCASGCDYTTVQAAVTAANGGDRIVLTAGETFTEEITLPAKSGVVTLTSSGTLPNRLIAPGDAAQLATIASGTNAAALVFPSTSTNWIVDGVRFLANTDGDGEVIQINKASHITLKRLLFDVSGATEQKRFILGNGTNITVTQTYCSGVWKAGQDSQCFAAWNGAGPYTLSANHFAAASENALFGGADPDSEADIPADILVEHNLFTKLEAWRGEARQVKNLFELKCAKRVIIRGNTFEKNWVDAQGGTAILFTPVNQDTNAPFCGLTDVLFEKNIVRDSPMGLSITGYGYEYGEGSGGQTTQTTNIVVKNNFWHMTTGRWADLSNEIGALTMEHNTYICDCEAGREMIFFGMEGEIWVRSELAERAPAFSVADFIFRNNFVQGNEYGMRSTNGFGNTTLTTRTSARTLANNVLGMATGFGGYPATTTIITKAALMAELDDANDYLLIALSTYKGDGTDGLDLGWLGQGIVEEEEEETPPPSATGVPFTHEVDFAVGDRVNGTKRVPPRDSSNLEPIRAKFANELHPQEAIASVVSITITPAGVNHATELVARRSVQTTSVVLWLQAGKSGVDYVIAIKITTTGGRTITRRFVQTVSDTLVLVLH